ncbi:hypothetical protein MLD38_001876 [Melastoma candidum]|uniref:Uncharacterized protein n=1 Tax=Melastoma candidum TaxID=119954 RepID=A0ACB9SFL2_9MYRT|nr:hypothetical protein MLD38_001876 [Melastoma candidum]
MNGQSLGLIRNVAVGSQRQNKTGAGVARNQRNGRDERQIPTNSSKNYSFRAADKQAGESEANQMVFPYPQKERTKVIRELSSEILTRGPKLCNFVEWRGFKVVYRRYASLYFCMCINQDDNELEVLEIIHHYVEILDRYFGSQKTVAKLIAGQDALVESAKEEASSISNIIAQATK